MKKIFLLTVVLIFFSMLAFGFIYISIHPYMGKDIANISDGWYLINNQTGRPEKAQIPGVMPSASVGEPFTIKRTLPAFEENRTVMFVSENARVIVEIDGRELGRWGYDDTAYTLPGRQIVVFSLPQEYSGRGIEITFTKYTSNALNSIYFGNSIDLMAYAISSDMPMIALTFFVTIIAIALMILFFVDTGNPHGNPSNLWFGIFTLLVGLYIPGRSHILCIMMSSSQSMLFIMILQYAIVISMMLFVISMCRKSKILIFVLLIIHIAVYIPAAVLHLYSPVKNVTLLYAFTYLHLVYFAAAIFALTVEIKAGRRHLWRLLWSFIIVVIGFALDTFEIQFKINALMPLEPYFFKIGLVIMIITEFITRLRDFIKEITAAQVEIRALSIKSGLLVENYRASQAHMENIRQIKHDINAHFSAISQLAANNSIKQVKDYLENLSGSYSLDKPLELCPHTLINAVINRAIKDAQDKGISFEYSVGISGPVTVKDHDICSLFVNLFDNAFEACKDCTDPWVKFNTQTKNNYLSISISNNYTAPIREKNGRYISAKRGGREYGTGLEIVNKIVEYYQGMLDISYDETCFKAELALKL